MDPLKESLISTLETLESGDFARDSSDALNQLVKAVAEHGKKGEMTIKLTIKPRGKNGQVEVTAEAKTKEPAPDRGVTMFFATEHGQLTRNNPRQPELPLDDDDNPRVVSMQKEAAGE